MTSDSNFFEAALLRTMTLLASLNVASELAFGMKERKAGRDPSTDEQEEILMPILRAELDTLNLLFFQLQSSLALSDPNADLNMAGENDAVQSRETRLPDAEPVHRFIDLIRLQKSTLALQRVHQRLLSLYPAVDEHTAEEARRLKNRCEALADAEAAQFTTSLESFLNEARPFVRKLSRLVNF